MKNLKHKIDNLPSSAGVYQFRDKSGRTIYVGKAKNLRNRVRHYFVHQPTAGPRLQRLMSLINDVDIFQTDSEVESLILEMNLIKKLKPRYNVNLKDDKSFPYIVITNEPYARVFPTRKRLDNKAKYFGPYTDVGTMKYALKMLRDLFMIRTCNLNITEEAIKEKRFKICLEYHIHKCEGPCEGLVSQERYNDMIDEVEKVLNGKTSTLIKELNSKMLEASKEEHFEEAAAIRNKISSLEVYTEKQKVVFEDLKDRDIFGFVTDENEGCAMVLNIREGKVIGKRHFYLDNIEEQPGSEILQNVLFRYYSENNFVPDEIFMQCELADEETMKKWFESAETGLKPVSAAGKSVEFVFPKRGEKIKLISMVQTNARYLLDELKLQRLKREFIPNSLMALKRDLRLTKIPRRIECFDISNIQGTDTVASMVVFEDARPKKSDYRKYKIRTALNEVGKPDDFAAMREVIYRRYRDNESAETGLRPVSAEKIRKLPLPDLVVVDGGKGQLTSAVGILRELEIKNLDIIGLAKRLEEVFVPGDSLPQSIPKTSSGLKLLQRVRDEAHRFAITYHRDVRHKRTLKSELEEIKGIGKKTTAKLLKEFGSVEKLKERLKERFAEVEESAGKKTAERLKTLIAGG
jgi:excinuclease ABC subunit C